MLDKISFKDFQKLNIRVGTVVEAEVPEWSHWVMKLVVNFGSEVGKKNVFAGVMKYYKPKDLLNKQFPFVVNMEPKKIGPKGDFSEAMLLAASIKVEDGKEGGEKPVLFKLSEKVLDGTRVR